MQYINNKVTETTQFFKAANPVELVEKFGSPLYVYNEKILRERMRQMKTLSSYEKFNALYSVKANGNIAILQIANEEGLGCDAMSPGEIHAELTAGFAPDRIFYISNNVSEEEMKFAIDRDVLVSIDSIGQLERFGRINSGGSVAIRFNGGIGAGHHEKVVTAGKNTKFGVNPEQIEEVKNILKKYNLKLTGINQHIGSLFMEGDQYIDSLGALFDIALQFEDLDFIDFGGGFGIPYQKQADQKPLDLKNLGVLIDDAIHQFMKKYGKEINVNIEPGRFIVAESCVLLGTVHAVKQSVSKYIGTDMGFNVIIRPVMYDSHHDIEIYRKSEERSMKEEAVTVVGNICESGDIIAKDRVLPEIFEDDILGILDAGAYCQSMSSNYNNRLKPAEVLLREDGSVVLIRKRDGFDDLLRNYIML